MSWGTVKAIDKRHLEDRLGPIDLTGVTVIAMDEFAIHKGRRYATVIVDPTFKRVLWVGRGRGRKDIRPLLGNRDNIKKDEDRVRLDELLAANRDLMTVYVLKNDIKEPWSHRTKKNARAAWESWFSRALESGIELLVAFVHKGGFRRPSDAGGV